MNVAPAPKGWKVSTAGRSLDVLSKQWMARPADERYLSMEDLRDALKDRAERTTEVKLQNRQLKVVSPEILQSDSRDVVLSKTNQLRLVGDKDQEYAPTNWAFGQIAQLAKAPAGYLRTLPGSIVSLNLQYGLHYNREVEDVKMYTDDLEALAVTGPNYGRIFDWEVAEAVWSSTQGAHGDNRWKVPGMLDWRTMHYDPLHPVTKDTTTLFANDRGVFIFLVQDLAPIEIGKLKSGEPDMVFRGFYVTNSEVGYGALKLGAMYLRAICCNRILWGVESFEELTMRHTKYAPNRFIEEAQPALRSFAEGSQQKLISGVHAAKEAVVAKTKDDALDFLVDRGIAAKRAQAIFDRIVREEWQAEDDEVDQHKVSIWDLSQGITAVARDEANFDVRMDMEQLAGRLLDKVA